MPSLDITNLLLVRCVRNGLITEYSKLKYHGTFMKICTTKIELQFQHIKKGGNVVYDENFMFEMNHHLSSNHFGIIILKQRENVIRSSSELSLGHIFKICDLNNRIHAAWFEMEKLNPTLENLDSPPQKLLQFLLISENLLVHLLIFENPIGIVTNRMPASVETVHIRDGAFELLEPQILLQNGVGAELLPSVEALDQHVEGVLDPEIPSAEEFEEDDVGAVVGIA